MKTKNILFIFILRIYTIIIFYKLRYLKKESMEERKIKNKFNKNLMIFIPDWLKWFSDNNLKGILIQQIQYKYAYVTDENEYMNLYKI